MSSLFLKFHLLTLCNVNFEKFLFDDLGFSSDNCKFFGFWKYFGILFVLPPAYHKVHTFQDFLGKFAFSLVSLRILTFFIELIAIRNILHNIRIKVRENELLKSVIDLCYLGAVAQDQNGLVKLVEDGFEFVLLRDSLFYL